MIVQAGASEPGRELAARTAEMIFTANQTLEDAQEFYSDVKGRLARYGRSPDELLISPASSRCWAAPRRKRRRTTTTSSR